MRSKSVRAKSARAKSVGTTLAALTLAALAVTVAAPAEAGLRHHDRVYADSFGNLVIDSAAGYKRIIVGEGKLARQLSDYTSAGQPKVIYQNESDDISGEGDCYRPPVFVKGRSYMYSLSDGEMPELSPCR
ncbi:hypothetical protein FJ872_31870 [Mesorhizobium sp. B2-5-9]|uniref:hypothetical protein n=1 Tax=unclassified Mesorhizobium TaxID=325217 RepID=UPI0011296815|nr:MULTISPECIES: hypothetical protein [unclassified Mesorhizobium]TPJ97663.1 hypothetical protein FJ872_31870 [Mesorhizobium sp. B2-5-9]TPK84321.1 hypothetical protein FJ936_16590 [Mesorhizobium sp. B2-4-13]